MARPSGRAGSRGRIHVVLWGVPTDSMPTDPRACGSQSELRSPARGSSLFLFLLALVVILPWSSAHAIDPHRTIAQYLSERWSSAQGFPGGTVTALAQSK